MSIEPARFSRKVFFVDAIQVTPENVISAAEWCGGEIKNAEKTGSEYVKVDVYQPRNARQSRAFIGDWIVKAENGTWRVYPHRAFMLAFEQTITDKKYITK